MRKSTIRQKILRSTPWELLWGSEAVTLPLLLRDSLVSAAPTSDVAISPDLSLAPRAEDDEAGAGGGAAGGAREAVAKMPKELLLCGGRGRSGSLR